MVQSAGNGGSPHIVTMAPIGLDAAVLDATQRQSLVAVRSLGQSGVRVGAFDVTPRAPAFRSRWCAATGVLPDFAQRRDEFVDALLQLIGRYSPRVLIVTDDSTIEVVRSRRSEVERHVSIALPPEESLAIAVSKARTLSLAEQLGIAVPRGVLVHDASELRAAVKEVGLPAVLKPVSSLVEGGDLHARLLSQVVVNHGEARRIAERVFAAGTSILVQQWLPGDREAVWVLYADGRFWARFVQVAHRTSPVLGGSSVVRESMPPRHDVIDPAEAIVASAGLVGVSDVEFRRDVEGRPRLMEINPRLSASVELAVRAGIDFPLLVYRWAAGCPMKSVSTYRIGVRMRWFSGDVQWLRETLRSQGRPDAKPAGRAIGVFLADCLRPSGYDYFSVCDPLPTISASMGFVVKAAKAAKALEKR